MGGKNHAPCRPYLENSTKFSRSLSLAFAELELANVSLEDCLLVELRGGGTPSLEKALRHLCSSRDALIQAQKDSVSLRQQMEDNCFADLPGLETTDLQEVATCFSERGLGSMDSWIRIIEEMEKGGFRAALSYFDDFIVQIIEGTEKLISQFADLEKNSLPANVVLEENRSGNIKKAFARLYTLWTVFNQDFLVSSLLSTELWYSFCGYSSLLQEEIHPVTA